MFGISKVSRSCAKRLRVVAVVAMAGLAASVLTASAAAQTISVSNTGSVSSGLGLTSVTFNNFNLNGGNAVVAFLTTDGTTASPTAMYGTQAMNVLTSATTTQRSSIFYLIDPTASSGNVVITLNGTGEGAASVMALDDVGAFSNSSGNTRTSAGGIALSYSGAAGGFVVGAMVDNTFSGSATPTVSGDNVDTNLQALAWNYAGTSSSGHLHAYGDIATTSASFSNTYTSSGGSSTSSRNAAVTAVFAPVPEPGSIALLGLTAAGLLLRRRSRDSV